MINYYKYLPTSDEDESWGLHVLSAGCNRIPENEIYPSLQHPAHHYFTWTKGRILDEFQVIYIARGEGIFESATCRKNIIKEGTVLLLFPGEWHRFKPNEKTGWDEYWVGFKGPIMDNLIQQEFFNRRKATLRVGIHDSIINLMLEIIEKTKNEKTGYQPMVAGIVMHLLGQIHTLVRQNNYKSEDITESIINKARIIFRTHIDQVITIENVAEELNVSYAWFRKAFKAYSGIAPHQYLLQLKIEKAKILLADPAMQVKEIAFNLNFKSTFYFSKLFKEKTGSSPAEFRKKMERKN
ncbi:AraC family transcriptional regulator [Agriterribacter sp.]|uniref:AraC family transcriptional regulator n=1 Tax=Agriterribacter sp. TaxID=2821509 RepID=UPI002BF45CA9|nr:AraC family transcriptional regulator [Agriterribacter sp.]HRP54933.1 AraC family transcriptional regulator [Agriterribacter sp.]